MLGAAVRWIIQTIQEFAAKRRLESKLGRKVRTDEIYSIGANIEAEEVNRSPFAPRTEPEAVEPMSSGTKKVLIAVGACVAILVIGGVLAVAVAIMPDDTYNRLNPFTPKTPIETFPSTIAVFERTREPKFRRLSGAEYYEFGTSYSRDSRTVNYTLYVFDDEASAIKRMVERYFVGGVPVVKEKSDTRIVIIDKETRRASIQFTNGKELIHINSSKIEDAIEFENAIPYTALGMAQPPKRVAPVDDLPLAPKTTKP